MLLASNVELLYIKLYETFNRNSRKGQGEGNPAYFRVKGIVCQRGK